MATPAPSPRWACRNDSCNACACTTWGCPKQLQALHRLKAALHDGLRHPVPGAELALRHGFYDQSHLGRDLRHLAGASLGRLQAGLRDTTGPLWALAAGVSR